MRKYENNLLKEIKNTYAFIYRPSHKENKRSNKKVDNLHYALLRHLSSELNDSSFELFTKETDGSELKANGYYYDKKTDVLIMNKKTKETIATIEFKMLLSSVQKNNNNNISNMIGDATNIRKAGIKTYWIYCISNTTPVYKSTGEIQSLYKIKEKYFDVYKKIYNDNYSEDYSIPNAVSFNILEDDIDLTKLKTKQELKIKYDNHINKDGFDIKLVDNIRYEKNNLFINEYDKFIKKMSEEIKNAIYQ